MVSKFLLVLGLYVLTLVASMFITQHGGISNYNGYILLIYCFLFFLLIKNKRLYAETLCFSAALILISFRVLSIYVLVDCAMIFFILSCLYAGCKWKLSLRQFKIVERTLIAIYFGALIGMLLPALYIDTNAGGVRYGGLFHAINFSANIFGITGIAIWEMCKARQHADTKKLLFLILSLILYMSVSGTRSLLFFIPYWGYQIWRYMKGIKYYKIILISLCFAFFLAIPMLLTLLQEKFRFQEGESSMATRAGLYWVLFEGLKESYFMVPNGVHSAHRLIINYTQNDEFSAHNDWLSYLYDWGVIFIIFLYDIYRKLKLYFCWNLEFILIFVGLSSVALHNMLFSMYVWIPFTIILLVRNNEKVIGCSTQVQ